MRADGIFIAIEIDDAHAADPDLAARLTDVCPVDIYAHHHGRLTIVEENIDECVLCGLCIDATGGRDGAVRVLALYDQVAQAR